MKEYWFPWSPTKFRQDTMHLTDDQELIYRRLIDFYMETKSPLPDNDQALANIARVSIEKFTQNSEVLRLFFSKARAKLQLKRCEAILSDQAQRTRSYSERGKKGGRKNDNEINGKKATAKLNASTLQDIDNTVEEKRVTNVTLKKKSIETLSVSDVAEWLNQKRALGKYLTIDEHGQLEYFKDYCRSKNLKYKDFIAAFRNSFNWENAITKGNGHETNFNGNGRNRVQKYTSADAKREALAHYGFSENEADHGDGGAMLFDTRHVRENGRTIEDFDDGNGGGSSTLPAKRN